MKQVVGTGKALKINLWRMYDNSEFKAYRVKASGY